MAEITYQMVLSTLQTIGLLVGIFYYVITLRNNQRNQQLALETRQVSTYIQTVGFRDKEFMKAWADIRFQEYTDYDDWNSKYGPETNPESFANFFTMCNLFQSLGSLVEQGMLSAETVYKQEGDQVIIICETQRNIIEGTRTRENYLHLFDSYESLYYRMIQLKNQELNR